VIYTRQSSENKESRHCVELKSTEVKIPKMREIRFALIANLIQMKQNRVSAICEKRDGQEWGSSNQTRPAWDCHKFSEGWKGAWLSHFQQQFDAGNGQVCKTPYRVSVAFNFDSAMVVQVHNSENIFVDE
jgi:hypothetical protein